MLGSVFLSLGMSLRLKNHIQTRVTVESGRPRPSSFLKCLGGIPKKDHLGPFPDIFLAASVRQRDEAMVRRELPKDQRDRIVKRYQSGEGYKRISKALDLPWNTVKTVILKWRKYGTTVTLPRTGRPRKIGEKSRRMWVREAAERPTATLKKMQEYPEEPARESAALAFPLDRGPPMDTSEPSSAAEEEEERSATELRPRTRSNPEGAEDRALSAQASVGSRSEGEGEAASTGDSPPSTPAPAAPDGKSWPPPAPPAEYQVKTPRVNCPEKVIICLDLSEEMSHPKLESFNGSKTNALNVSQKMIEMFVRTKHKIDKSHEFALVVVNNDVTWLSGFTSDPREVCSCLYDLETVVCKTFNLEGLFSLIQQRTELPITENVQTIPPPYVVRTILVYSRPGCQPPVAVTDQMKKMLQCPYYFFDVLYVHNGMEEKEEESSWKETFAAFSNLDTKGTNYKYEVSLTGPAVELHNCMAKLLAHPLQRPFQTHAAYSMLEDEEPPEMEAVV